MDPDSEEEVKWISLCKNVFWCSVRIDWLGSIMVCFSEYSIFMICWLVDWMVGWMGYEL